MFLQGATDEERRSKAKARTTKGAWWRLWIPKAVLRTVFTDSTMSMRQAARTHKAAHSHVTNTVLSTAQVQHSLQKSQLESFTQEGVHDVQWLIYTLQFDETEFSVASGDPSLVSERPLFTQHGRIQWRETSSTETFCEECVYPPTALEAKTADNMLEAIRRKHDGVILGLMQNTPLGCMLVNCDSVSSNLKVVRLIFNMFLPATAMLLFCRCLQHQASLIISTITVHQQFLTGLFCTARQLQKGSVLDGVEIGLREILNRDLVIDHLHPPDPANVARTTELLNTIYASPVARASVGTPQEDEAAEKEENFARQDEVDAIKTVFNADTRSYIPKHHCQGCCRSRKDTIDKAVSALMRPLQRRVVIPALNRWTSLFPVIRAVTLLLQIHMLYARAVCWHFGRDLSIEKLEAQAPREREAEESEESEEEAPDPGLQFGAPVDAQKHWQRENRKRNKKMMSFLCNAKVAWQLMLWLAVGVQVMYLHHWLFKRGALNGKTDEDGYGALMLCCLLDRYPAMRILNLLGGLAEEEGDLHHSENIWALVESIYGPQATWNQEMLQEANAIVNLAIAGLYRRFIVSHRAYPWRLAIVADTKTPMVRRRSVALEFWLLSPCCLDPMFSRRFRQLLCNWEQIFHPVVQEFLQRVFHNAICASTNLENQFAHIRRWLSTCWRSPTILWLTCARQRCKLETGPKFGGWGWEAGRSMSGPRVQGP